MKFAGAHQCTRDEASPGTPGAGRLDGGGYDGHRTPVCAQRCGVPGDLCAWARAWVLQSSLARHQELQATQARQRMTAVFALTAARFLWRSRNVEIVVARFIISGP